ncbi:MAG TPA: ABC transporter substrate-binding protein, partial [Chloroflexi bacterium]|nr:ABC transporter substrate-binding protein [Chloroflexota bacterium]
TPAAAPTEPPAAVPTAAPEPTKAPEPTATTAPEPTPAPEATAEPTTEAMSGEIAPGEIAAGEITVGLMTDDSGSLAVYGPLLERGFAMGLKYADEKLGLGACKIDVVTKDNASDPDTAVKQARELIESEGADVLVGTVSSGATLAVQNVAAENKIVLIAAPAASPDITGKNFNEYTFRTSRTSVMDALTMGAALVQQYKGPFVQIAPDYAFGQGSAAAFRSVVGANGGEFAADDIFIPQETSDFTPYLQQVLDSGAKVLIVTWAGAGFVPLFQQMQELGIFDEMTVATGIGDNQTLAKGYADAIGSVGVNVYHYTLPHNSINDWLVEQHKAEYNEPPDLFTADGFAAAIMLMEGLKKTGCDASAQKLIPAFEGLEFDAAKGHYIIRKGDHVALQPMYLVRLDNVTDPDYKFLKLIQEFGPEEVAPPCAAPEDRCKMNEQ